MGHGGVLAKDADYSRAYILIFKFKESTNGIMVVNHNAQYSPTLYLTEKEKKKNIVEPGKYDQKFYFVK